MSRDGWSTLLEVYDRIEAEILKESLEAMGIPATLFHEGVGNLYPTTFGPLAKVEVACTTKLPATNPLGATVTVRLAGDTA